MSPEDLAELKRLSEAGDAAGLLQWIRADQQKQGVYETEQEIAKEIEAEEKSPEAKKRKKLILDAVSKRQSVKNNKKQQRKQRNIFTPREDRRVNLEKELPTAESLGLEKFDTEREFWSSPKLEKSDTVIDYGVLRDIWSQSDSKLSLREFEQQYDNKHYRNILKHKYGLTGSPPFRVKLPNEKEWGDDSTGKLQTTVPDQETLYSDPTPLLPGAATYRAPLSRKPIELQDRWKKFIEKAQKELKESVSKSVDEQVSQATSSGKDAEYNIDWSNIDKDGKYKHKIRDWTDRIIKKKFKRAEADFDAQQAKAKEEVYDAILERAYREKVVEKGVEKADEKYHGKLLNAETSLQREFSDIKKEQAVSVELYGEGNEALWKTKTNYLDEIIKRNSFNYDPRVDGDVTREDGESWFQAYTKRLHQAQKYNPDYIRKTNLISNLRPSEIDRDQLYSRTDPISGAINQEELFYREELIKDQKERRQKEQRDTKYNEWLKTSYAGRYQKSKGWATERPINPEEQVDKHLRFINWNQMSSQISPMTGQLSLGQPNHQSVGVSSASNVIQALVAGFSPAVAGLTQFAGVIQTTAQAVSDFGENLKTNARIRENLQSTFLPETSVQMAQLKRSLRDAVGNMWADQAGDVIIRGNSLIDKWKDPKSLRGGLHALESAVTPFKHFKDNETGVMSYNMADMASVSAQKLAGSLDKNRPFEAIKHYREFLSRLEKHRESGQVAIGPGANSWDEFTKFNEIVAPHIEKLIGSIVDKVNPETIRADNWQSVGNITGDYGSISLLSVNQQMLQELQQINVSMHENLDIINRIGWFRN